MKAPNRCFLILGILVALAGTMYAEDGGTAGNDGGSVTAGSFTYTYPIDLPPGTNGMAPSLSLKYDSSDGNGMLGMGFSLSGLPVISRDTSYPVNFDENDHYVYEGQKLIKGSDGYYHTECESFVRIKAVNLDSAYSHWVVTLKNGTKLYFGDTADSWIDAAPVDSHPGEARLWALSRVEDVYGNYYEVEYLEDTTGGDYYPLKITYTKGNGLTKYRTVEFGYASRVDWVNSGYPSYVSFDKCLTTISISVDGSLLKKYHIEYETGVTTSRSRIKGITEFGEDGVASMPTVGFNWQEGGSWFPKTVISGPVGYDQDKISVGDVNGDGKDDLMLVASNGFHSVLISDGEELHPQLGVQIGLGYSTVVGDFNGDGLKDFAAYSSTGMAWLIRSTGTGFIAKSCSVMAGYEQNNLSVGDVNGDGKDDLMLISSNGFHSVLISDGEEFHDQPGIQIGVGYSTVVGDFNGDGLKDFAAYSATGTAWLIRSTGTGFVASACSVLNGYDQNRISVGDVNGDGKDDLMLVASNGFHGVLLSDGETFFSQIVAQLGQEYSTVVGDFNGDGLKDFAAYTASGTACLIRSTGTEFIARSCSVLEGYDQYRISVGDANGDGKDDLMMSASNGFRGVLLSDGETFLSEIVAQIGEGYSNIVGDFNGDEKADFGAYRSADGTYWHAESSGQIPDLLTGVTGINESNITVYYSPAALVDNAIVPIVSSYPIVSNTQVRPLVTKVDYADGFGTTIEKSYEYSNGLIHKTFPRNNKDLGFQVFREKVKQPDGTYITTETEFQYGDTAAEKKLYAGLPKRRTTYGTDGKKYGETRYSYAADTTATTGVSFVHRTEELSLNYNGDDTEASAVRTKTTYAYDGYGNLTSTVAYGEVDASGVDILQDKTETVREYASDTEAWIFTPSAQTVKAFDLAGNFGTASETRFFYYADAGGRDFGDGIAAAGSPGARGLIARVEFENGDEDSSGAFAYYENGNLWKTKDAKGTVSRTIEYDSGYATAPTAETNALGETTRTIYDEFLRPVEMVDAAGISSYVKYDDFGRVESAWGYGDSETSPTSKYEYFDDAALPASPAYVQVKTKNGENDYLTSRTYYDGFGRKIQAKQELEIDDEWVAVDYRYDEAGRLSRTSIPYVSGSKDFNEGDERSSSARRFTSIAFDPIGRPSKRTNADETTAYLLYGRRYIAAVDSEGHVKAREAVGDQVFSYAYNRLDYSGQDYAYMQENFASCKDLWYYRTRTQAGRNGAIIAERSGENAAENVITVSTDMLGRKTSYSDPDKGTWTYEHDANGNLLRQLDAAGNEIRFDYDDLDRPVKKYRGGMAAAEYTYKVTGQLGSVSYAEGYDAFTYDQLGFLTGFSRTITGYGTRLFASTYDTIGRPLDFTFPDGEKVEYAYNAGGNLETVRGTDYYVTDIDYNERGKVTSMSFGNGKTTAYAYDPANGRMTGMDVDGVLDFTYVYDFVGNITRKEDNLDSAYTENFAYDEFYRLTSALGIYGGKAFTYDAYNRITSKDGNYYYYATAGGTRPHAPISDGLNAFTYDANGNMTSGKGRSIVYDAENRVTSITKDGNPTTFAYDDFGRRLVKTVGSGTTVYWSADYEEKYVSGTLTESTKYYMANGRKIAQRNSVSGLMYIHQDHLGSTTKLTDASGAVTQSMGYTPYGSDAYSLGGNYTDYQFTGQEKDASTGLYYYGARYYDPDLGLFIQADTVLDGMNRYAYCGNNPVMYTDPTGFENTSIQTSPNTSLTLGDYYDGPDNRTDSANDSDESAQDDDDSNDQQSAETETKVQSGGGGDSGSGGGGSESQSSKKKNKGKSKEKNEDVAEVKSGVGRFNIIDFGIDYSGDAWNELQRGNIIGWAGYELASTSELVVGLCAAYYGPLFVRAAITAVPVLLDKAKTIIGEKTIAGRRGTDPSKIDLQWFAEDAKTIQTGGNTLSKSTLKALGLSKEEGKMAIEGLKNYLGKRNDFHQIIKANGDYVDGNTREVLGNLFDFIH